MPTILPDTGAVPARPFPDRIVANASAYLGVTEKPPGSNHGPDIDEWCYEANGIRGGYPWCAAFACAMSARAGFRIDEPKRASVGFLVQWAQRTGRVVTRPLRGDLVCYRFDADSWADHVGIVERVVGVSWRGGRFVGAIRTIEGNTSSGPSGSQSNGGGVFRRTRVCSGRETFIRLVPRAR